MKETIKTFLNDSPPFVQELARTLYGDAVSIYSEHFNPDSRLYWLYLVSFLSVALFSYAYYYKSEHHGTFTLKQFLRFALPKHIYLHPSALLDYQLYIAKHFFGFSPSMLWLFTEASVIHFVTRWLTSWFGPHTHALPSPWWTMLALTMTVALVEDFGDYVNHAMRHYLPVLWPFHRVHHSAEVLTPLTLWRMHPLDGFLSAPLTMTLPVVVQGFLFYLFLEKPNVITILHVNAAVWVFDVFGSNLRHSHIWLSFGPVLSHIVLSPAQHQIHHSVAPQHWNKNFGVTFALWDWMFGTLYIPQEKEALVFGLGDGQPQRHPSLLHAYTEPLIEMGRLLRLSYCNWRMRYRTLFLKAKLKEGKPQELCSLHASRQQAVAAPATKGSDLLRTSKPM